MSQTYLTDHSTDTLQAVKAQPVTSLSASTDFNYPIIVHSHLRWDWVWQRPQQFLSRLSKRHRILFVEGPFVEDIDKAYYVLKPANDYPNIVIMQTHFPASRWSDGAWVDSERRRMLCEVLAGPMGRRLEGAVQWFYDPMATTAFAGRLNESAIVYDCMDELSQFKGAPPALVQRERELLAHADVVFAGGRKMHESKSRFNSNAHFYGCGVDVEHFGKARSPKTEIPADIANLEGPILGYFGVVDERMDYELVAKLADANPDWNVVIVGPMTKIDEDDLPRRHNIRWMGGRDYSELPAYTKAFDVCLMPFALNEATEYINPTKALEYMATGSPIVSSAVPDVVSNFATVVKVAASHEEFIAFCEAAVSSPDEVAIERGLKMAQANTWEAIVAKLEGHINDVLAARSEFDELDVMEASSSVSAA